MKDNGSPLSEGMFAIRTSNLGDVPFSMFVFIPLNRIGFVKLIASCWFWNMAFASLEDTDSAPGLVYPPSYNFLSQAAAFAPFSSSNTMFPSLSKNGLPNALR
ncbi:hypothetical protein D3C77_681740 [compost metagenome]